MSSVPAKITSPSDLWRWLSQLRDRELCRSDWQRRLGDGYDLVASFLEPMPGTEAETYPDPESGLELIPRRIHDGTYTARPDDPEETRLPAVRGLTDDDVLRWTFRWDKIAEAISAAFGIQSHPGPGPFETPWIRSLGLSRGSARDLPALLMITADVREALTWVRLLLQGEPRLLILTVHDQLCGDLATAHGHGYLGLNRDTGFLRVKGQWVLAARARRKDIGSTKAGDAGFAMPTDSVWMNEVFDLELNGAQVRVFGGRFALGESVVPRAIAKTCAGRVRLILHDHAVEFNVIGLEELKPVRIVRLVTEGVKNRVEFEGGVIRDIDLVTWPDLDADEKSVVRGADAVRGMAGDVLFGGLPSATFENGWRSIRLPSGKKLNLSGRRVKRRGILEAIWKHCVDKRTLQFAFATVRTGYNERVGKGSQCKSDRLNYDVFSGQAQEFQEMFEHVGAARDEIYRLKVRFVKPG